MNKFRTAISKLWKMERNHSSSLSECRCGGPVCCRPEKAFVIAAAGIAAYVAAAAVLQRRYDTGCLYSPPVLVDVAKKCVGW